MHKSIKSLTIASTLLTIIVLVCAFFLYYKYSNPAPLSSSKPSPSVLEGVIADSISINQGTQGQFGDLQIGLGNNKVDDYINDNGSKEHGNTAQLWISIRNNNAQNNSFDVYAGKSFIFDKYHIFVDQVTVNHTILSSSKIGGQGGTIKLLIWESVK